MSSCSFADADHGWIVGDGGSRGCILEATADGGLTWTAETSGPTGDLFAVSATSSQTALASGGEGELLRTTDGGATWEPRDSETSQTLWSLASVGASETWAVGDNGVIRHTTDGGESWAAQSSGTTAWLGSAWFVDSTHGWAAGGGGTLLATSDGGATWSKLSGAPSADIWCVRFVDKDVGWVVAGADRALYKTSDSGATWTRQDPALSAGLGVASMAFTDADHGWVVGGNGSIAHTTDGGATWTQQYSRTGWGLTTVRDIDASSAVALSVRGDVLRTDDSGDTWWQQVSPGVAANDVDFADGTTGWMVGNTGAIAKTTDGGGAQPAPASLQGTVRSAATNSPLPGVAVTLETYPTVYTDSAGHYLVPNIVPGVYYDVTFGVEGYAAGGLRYVEFDAGSVVNQDMSLLAITSVGITPAKAAKGRLAVNVGVAPGHAATITLRYDRLVGRTYVHLRNVALKIPASGKVTYSRKMAEGTWRVRVSVPGTRGYTSATSGWAAVRVR